MRSYVIVNTSELDGFDFSTVIQESADNLVFSLDGSKAVLKYEGTQPFDLAGKTEYSQQEILEVLKSSEWSEPIVQP
jgi:hypothetical protein